MQYIAMLVCFDVVSQCNMEHNYSLKSGSMSGTGHYFWLSLFYTSIQYLSMPDIGLN